MTQKTIKAITLYQPWASLVALGFKTIETRSWSTNFRGELAIHAGMNDRNMKLIAEPPLSSVLGGVNRVFPFGQVVAICRLKDCIRIATTCVNHVWPENGDHKMIYLKIPPPSPELEFGDYTPGRWAWILEEVRILSKPIPATGKQRLWDFTFEEAK